jgi:hypothetical protein
MARLKASGEREWLAIAGGMAAGANIVTFTLP